MNKFLMKIDKNVIKVLQSGLRVSIPTTLSKITESFEKAKNGLGKMRFSYPKHRNQYDIRICMGPWLIPVCTALRFNLEILVLELLNLITRWRWGVKFSRRVS